MRLSAGVHRCVGHEPPMSGAGTLGIGALYPAAAGVRTTFGIPILDVGASKCIAPENGCKVIGDGNPVQQRGSGKYGDETVAFS